MGRRKIEIKRIENKGQRQVAFSKRRTGLFNKAKELCILTGADVAAIVFSPAGKVFTFGHPSVDSVVDSFLTRNSPPAPNDAILEEYMEVLSQLEAEKKLL